MAEYPVKNGAGADIVTGYDVDAHPFVPRDPAGDYPVKNGLGQNIIAAAPTLTKTWPTRPDGQRVVSRYPVKDGLGGDIVLGTGGVSYDADAVALFARMAAAGEEPSAARKLLYNTAIVDWKASGFWADCRGLYVMASHGPISGRMNWKGDIYNLTPVNSPAFTIDRGYLSDGSSSYLDTGYDPLTVNEGFTQDSGHIGVWSRTDGQSAASDCGNGNTIILARSTTDVVFHRINASGSASVANTDGRGHFVANRIVSTNSRVNRNGSLLANSVLASASMASGNFRFCGRSTTVQYSARQQALGHFGVGLSEAEIAAAYATALTLFIAIGAA